MAQKWSPPPLLLPLVISIWVAGAAATPIPTHVSYVCVWVCCICVLLTLSRCFSTIIAPFEPNRLRLTKDAEAGQGRDGTGIEAIQAHNALISGTRHTTHSATHALVRPLDFATFCGVCICMRPMRRIRNKRHLEQLPRSSSSSNRGCSSAEEKSGEGEGSAETMLGAIKTQAIKWIFMPHFRNACSVAHISRLPFLFLLLCSAPKTAQAQNAAKRVVSSLLKIQVSLTMQVCKYR